MFSKRAICWEIRARENGYHRLVFHARGQAADKELAVREGLRRLSTQRPGWSWPDAPLYPAEEPFGADSLIQAIQIDYPQRSSWTSGTDWWVVYWVEASIVAALFLRRFVDVSI